MDNGWNYLRLPSSYISKEHCRIECLEGGKILLHDNSLNGTYVNGINVKDVVDLKEDDVLDISLNGTYVNGNKVKNVVDLREGDVIGKFFFVPSKINKIDLDLF